MFSEREKVTENLLKQKQAGSSSSQQLSYLTGSLHKGIKMMKGDERIKFSFSKTFLSIVLIAY